MNDLLLESCYYELGDCIADYEEQSVFEARINEMFKINLAECNSVASLQEGFKEVAQKISEAVVALITKIKAFIDRLRAKASLMALTSLEENALKLKEKAIKDNLGDKKLPNDIIVFTSAEVSVTIGDAIGRELGEMAASFGDKIHTPDLDDGDIDTAKDAISKVSDEVSKTASDIKDNWSDIKPKIDAIFKKYNLTQEGYKNAIEAVSENDTSKFDKATQVIAAKLSTVNDVIKYYARVTKPGVHKAMYTNAIDILTKAKKGLEKVVAFLKKRTGLINGSEARGIIIAGNMVYSHLMKTIMIDIKSFKRANIAMSKAIGGKSSNSSNNKEEKNNNL